MRIAIAILCMFIAVGTQPDYPLIKTFLWACAWFGFAAVLVWPLRRTV